MTRTASNWHSYQQAAADLFIRLGCDAAVDATISGVRSRHNVDVLVRFRRWGIPQLWLIECKKHSAPVKKRDVEALKSIASDVGADRAFVLSESGFQPAARAAARITNVTLTSLADLSENVKAAVLESLLATVEARAAELHERIGALRVVTSSGPGSLTSSPRPGVRSDIYKEVVPSLFLDAVQRARTDRFPAAVPDPTDETALRPVMSADELVEIAFPKLAQIDRWVREQEGGLTFSGP